MTQTNVCFLCHEELEGVIEVLTVAIGRLAISRLRETSDCNWTHCKKCKQVICKQCYKAPKVFCCETAFSKRRDEILNGEEVHSKKPTESKCN